MKYIINYIKKSPFLLSILGAILIWAILLILQASLISTNTAFGYWFANLKNHIPISRTVAPSIIVVEIDNTSLNAFGFPMDRSHYAPVIDNLTQAGVAAIGLDIIFEDPSNSLSDDIFAESIQKSQKVLLGFSSIDNAPWKIFEKFEPYIVWRGFFDVPTDRSGGVQNVSVVKDLRDRNTYDYFPIAVLKFALGQWAYQTRVQTWELQITANMTTQASREATMMWVSFLPRHHFTRLSFVSLHDPEQFKALTQTIAFKDAIVLLWMTADGTKDIFSTPNGQDYGVYLHANTINTLLQGYGFAYFNPFIQSAILFFLLVLSCYSNLTQRWYGLVLSNIAIIIIFLLIFPCLVLFATDLIPSFYIEFLLGLILVLVFSNMVKYFLENKDKKRLHSALWEYVSKEVSSEILSGKGMIQFDGEKKRIAMFFSDIEWFTSISEKFTPEKLVYFLREYLGNMSHIIMDERWFINKYEWDAIMALWGAFWLDDKTVYYACDAAIKQQKSLQKLNEKWQENGQFEPLKVRMWIHVWEAILWNIWAVWRKLEFTALWDHVNLASRLEWINKYYNSYICVSQDVYYEMKDDFEFRYLDNIRVKGKNQAIKIYELLSYKWDLSNEAQLQYQQFGQAMDLYYRQDFQAAADMFTQLISLWDGPSLTYLQRCEDFTKNPPGASWDMIWTFSSK